MSGRGGGSKKNEVDWDKPPAGSNTLTWSFAARGGTKPFRRDRVVGGSRGPLKEEVT